MDAQPLRQAHRNLNARGDHDLWSYYPKGAKRVAHTGSLLARGVSFKQPSGKAFAATLEGGPRAVFAWLRAESFSIDVTPETLRDTVNTHPRITYSASMWKRLRFNPRAGHQCFQDSDGRRIESAELVYLAPDGCAYFYGGS